jgi:hypothetical protein
MKLNALLIFFSLTILISCNGQKTTQRANTNSSINLADTVSIPSTSIWIVFQANIGDYWFGSDTDRAYRYDGKTIVHFSASEPLYGRRVFC